MLKVSAKTVFARVFIEQMWIWAGRGRNGKGWWTEILVTLLGAYANNPSLDLITSRLPPANSPSPALLALRGVRGAFITEAEKNLKFHTSTLKLLRDHASKLTSRNLFRDLVSFRPCCSLIVSTNVKVAFTTVDEGLELSLGVVPWCFQFVKTPTEDNHRVVNPSLKGEDSIQKMLPAVFWLLAQVDKCFVKDWDGTVVGPEPVQVSEAKKEFLRERSAGSVEAFRDEKCGETTDYKEATTEAKIQASFMTYMADTMAKVDAHAAFEQSFTGVIAHGRRLCRVTKAARGCYVRLK